MMKFATKLLVLAVLGVSGLALLHPAPAAADLYGWRQDRGDAAKTGSRYLNALPVGQVEWRVDAGRMVDSSPVVAAADSAAGTIYVGTVGGLGPCILQCHWSLVAINPDGTRKWRISLQAGGMLYSVRTAPAIRGDGLAVVGYRKEAHSDGGWGLKGRVFLVSFEGAILRTSGEFDGGGLSSPLMSFNHVFVLSHPGGSDDLIRKFDSTTFGESWIGGIHYGITGGAKCDIGCYDPYWPLSMFGTYDPDQRTQLPSPSRDSVYPEIVQPSAQTARFWESGGQIWQKDAIGITTAPSVGGDFFVGVATTLNGGYADGRLEGRNATGGRAWQANLGGLPRGVAYSDSGKDHVYVSASDGSLSSYRVTGDFRWRQQVGNAGRIGLPVVVKAGGAELVIVGTNQNTLTAFDVYGNVAWVLPLDSPALGSPAIADGRIYVATQKSLYAIR
jgi:putative pyrroloquinoline-quinone-binding quinoprotein